MMQTKFVPLLMIGCLATVTGLLLPGCYEDGGDLTDRIPQVLYGPSVMELLTTQEDLTFEKLGEIQQSQSSQGITVRNMELQADPEEVFHTGETWPEDEVDMDSENDLLFAVIAEHPGDDEYYQTTVTFETDAHKYDGEVLREADEREFNEIEIDVVAPPPEED